MFLGAYKYFFCNNTNDRRSLLRIEFDICNGKESSNVLFKICLFESQQRGVDPEWNQELRNCLHINKVSLTEPLAISQCLVHYLPKEISSSLTYYFLALRYAYLNIKQCYNSSFLFIRAHTGSIHHTVADVAIMMYL